MQKRILIFLIGTLIALIGWSQINPVTPAQSAVLWPTLELVPFVEGLSSPVHITNARDGSNRLFIVERAGVIRIIENGVLLGTPFLDIQDRVKGGGEEGLLSVAFPPDFSFKDYFYVYYTNNNGDNQVSRFSLSNDPNIANASTEKLILYLDHPGYSNHNGGQLAFGPDGYLYIGTGDGGGAGDPNGNAQDPASLLGKILRIDVEINPPAIASSAYETFLPFVSAESGAVPAYRIPPDNPYADTPGYRGEIWALGLRNPWRFSFDRNHGDLYIGDVGQGSWEEIDFQLVNSPGGENYGWNEMEGRHCFLPNCNTSGMTMPLFEYPTHEQGSCSVTGGYVYRGSTYVEMQGIYLFADFCNGVITGLENNNGVWSGEVLLDTPNNISTFGEDEFGELYLADISSGEIFQIVANTP